MPGVPSSPADGPRPDGHDPSVDEDDPEPAHEHGIDPDDLDEADGFDGDVWHGLPRRLWPTVLLVAIQGWLLLGVLLVVAEVVGVPAPPAVGDARSVVPWVAQDVWSVVADAAWILVVSVVVAALLRRALGNRGTWPLPARADLTVVVAQAVVVAMAVWPAVFPGVSTVTTSIGAMLLTILLLRLREVYVGRDLVGPWGRRRASVAVAVPLALVVAYAAWHPLLVPSVSVRTSAGASVVGGDDETSGEQAEGEDVETTTGGDDVRIETEPRRTVRLSVTIDAATGGVRLLGVTPVVPGGAFRQTATPAAGADGPSAVGSPLPLRLPRAESIDRAFGLRAVGRCDRQDQRIDRVRVRYRRLGRTITTELATDAAVTLVCDPSR